MNEIVSSDDSEIEAGILPIPVGSRPRLRLFLLWFWTVNVAVYLVCLVKFGTSGLSL